MPDEARPLKRGAIAPWAKSTSPYYGQTLEALARHYSFSMTTPWAELPEKVRDAILYGSGDETIRMAYDDGLRAYEVKKPFEGVIPNLERRYKETESDWAREEIGRYMCETPCEACERQAAEARGARGEDRRLRHRRGDARSRCARRVAWFEALPDAARRQAERDRRPHPEGDPRPPDASSSMSGLEYLTLARASGTLSGGESQRIRLASQIGSGLTGVLYVLDEPSIGLHQRDNERLLGTLKRLRDLGNTVIVVEHDEDAILQADYVVRCRPRRRHPWRRDRRRRHARRGHGEPEFAHRQIPHRRDVGAGAGSSAASRRRAAC